jgi:membrane protein
VTFVRFILFCIDTTNEFLEKNCPYIAGAIAFYTLFSIFPLLLAVISVLGYLGPSTEEAQLRLAMRLADIVPVSSDFIGETVSGVVSARAITGIASIFGLLWAATAVFGAMRKGINAAWGIKTPRPFLKERLIDFTLVLGAGTLLLAVLFSSPALAFAREATDVLAPESEFFNHLMWNVVARLLLPSLAFVTFLVLYKFLPNTHVELGHVWPGALAASVAFDAANFSFVWYVQNYGHYNLVYGSVGTILALLTWVYLSAIILLLGALVTSRYTAYVASLPEQRRKLTILWTGFSRVRIRLVGARVE